MDLGEDKVGGVTVVGVRGRIDSTTAPVLGERLTASLEGPKVRVLLDLSRIEGGAPGEARRAGACARAGARR